MYCVKLAQVWNRVHTYIESSRVGSLGNKVGVDNNSQHAIQLGAAKVRLVGRFSFRVTYVRAYSSSIVMHVGGG